MESFKATGELVFQSLAFESGGKGSDVLGGETASVLFVAGNRVPGISESIRNIDSETAQEINNAAETIKIDRQGIINR